jgi:putative acetyltransferase
VKVLGLDISYKTATETHDFADGKDLFQQYANSLKIDLSFQDFANELNSINQVYNKPKGALLLAYSDKIAIGCVGIREIDMDTAELKRMFVQDKFKGNGIGRKLLALSIDVAQKLGYKRIRLDTLADMTQALNLYRSVGFYEIPAYRFNPIEGAVYMEKKIIRG